MKRAKNGENSDDDIRYVETLNEQPRYYRPPSLSMVTLTPEHHSILSKLRNKVKIIEESNEDEEQEQQQPPNSEDDNHQYDNMTNNHNGKDNMTNNHNGKDNMTNNDNGKGEDEDDNNDGNGAQFSNNQPPPPPPPPTMIEQQSINNNNQNDGDDDNSKYYNKETISTTSLTSKMSTKSMVNNMIVVVDNNEIINNKSNNNHNNNRYKRKFSASDLKIRSIVYGENNDPEDYDDDNTDDGDSNDGSDDDSDGDDDDNTNNNHNDNTNKNNNNSNNDGHHHHHKDNIVRFDVDNRTIDDNKEITMKPVEYLNNMNNNNQNYNNQTNGKDQQHHHQQQQRFLQQFYDNKLHKSISNYEIKHIEDSISAIIAPSAAISTIQPKTKSILKHSDRAKRSLANQNDKLSIGECSIGTFGENYSDNRINKYQKQQSIEQYLHSRTIKLLSIIYAMIVIIIGAMFTISDMDNEINNNDHIYSIVITLIGVIFLIYLHIDIQRHKHFVLAWQKRRKELIAAPLRQMTDDDNYNNNYNLNGNFDSINPNANDQCNDKDYDTLSVTTAILFNRIYQLDNRLNNMDKNIDNGDELIDEETNRKLNSYRFLIGKHSGNAFLKIGMTLFCMGSIIHQGINLAFEIHYFATNAEQCKNSVSIIVYLVRCLAAFYQLYIVFKYSNLIINRNQSIVRFGLMHLMGSSLSTWLSTIIEESIHDYMGKMANIIDEEHHHHLENISQSSSISKNNFIFLERTYEHHEYCMNKTLSDFGSMETISLLYPFTVEYNIILASVWFIIWMNVDNDDSQSKLQIMNEELAQDEHTGRIEINYHSNMQLSADFHASDFGLFGGILAFLIITITIIIFFITINKEQFENIGVIIFTVQLSLLTICCSITVPLASRNTMKLNVTNFDHISSPPLLMDDLLLILPLPFYYIHNILCIYSEISSLAESTRKINDIFIIICYSFNLVQVTIQSLFIIDGARRCSNDFRLRKKKPGKQSITFLIILNITLWILITFELKAIDKYHPMGDIYGKFVWMIILDTCLPSMLFYRFHSSVCLAHMWKNCYEKDEH